MSKSRLNNKRLVVIFAVLIFIVVIIILGSTMFNLKNVEVKFTTSYQNAVSADAVRDRCEKFKGKNLLFLSKKNVVSYLQESFVYAKDISIERKFPNTMVVRLAERQEVYTIRLKNESGEELYYMYDADGTALRTDITNTNNAVSTLEEQNVLVTGITDDDVMANVVGKRIQLHNPAKINCVADVLEALKGLRYSETDIRHFIVQLDVSDLKYGPVLTTGIRGVDDKLRAALKIHLQNSEDIVNLMAHAIGTFNKWQQDSVGQIKSGTMHVYYDQTLNKYSASYEKTDK